MEADPALKRVIDELSGDDDILLAIAFGSVAQGRAVFDSDIDIGVWAAKGELEAERKLKLIRDIATVTGRAVDLIDLRVTGVPLMRTILVEGTVLIERDSNLRPYLTSRMLADVEDFLPLRERLLSERRQRWLG